MMLNRSLGRITRYVPILVVLAPLLSACSETRTPAWTQEDATDYERTIDAIDGLVLTTSAATEEWSRAWSRAIERQQDFNVALRQHAEEPATKGARESILKLRGALAERIRRLARRPIPSRAMEALLAAHTPAMRLVEYAVEPTGSLSNYNQAVAELRILAKGQMQTALALLPPTIENSK